MQRSRRFLGAGLRDYVQRHGAFRHGPERDKIGEINSYSLFAGLYRTLSQGLAARGRGNHAAGGVNARSSWSSPRMTAASRPTRSRRHELVSSRTW